MRDIVKLTGMVLKASPVRETDKRLVILTRERGKITAFARGAKRPGNQLMAVCRPFVFGQFQLSEGREAYSLYSGEISNYFEELAGDMEATCYGSYFLELTDYYTRENVESSQMLLLLYQSLRALLKPALPNTLVQRIFELRTMMLNGEYTEHPPEQVGESANYAWEYVLSVPLESLYTFQLNSRSFQEFSRCVEKNKRKFIDREFYSLEILKTLSDS